MCIRLCRIFAITVSSIGAFAAAAWAQSNVDATDKFSWGENVGWMNWRDADSGISGVTVASTYLTGFIWGEEVGWINVGNGPPAGGIHHENSSGLDFGVNIDTNGELFGLGWGENIGWINFDTASAGADSARFDACHHQFSGFAWGESVGWINLGDASQYVAVGPCAPGDYDCDGDLDLVDYAAMAERLTGPEIPVNCPALDMDSDEDIDMQDFAAFQQG